MKAAILILTSLFSAHCFAESWGTVIDGDTIDFPLPDGGKERVRLYGIDTPEMAQPYGEEAKRALYEYARGETLEIAPTGIDPYDRVLAIFYHRTTNASIQSYMVEAGLAWVDPRYCKLPECSFWETLEKRAQVQRVGLWSQDNPEAPWDYRGRN